MALIAVATLSSFWSTSMLLERQAGDAEIVDMAGRQRMLSQRLVLLAHDLQVERPESAERLLAAQGRFAGSHARLLDSAQLSLGDDPSVVAAMRRVDIAFGPVDAALEPIVAAAQADGGVDEAALVALRHSTDAFLPEMDAAVATYAEVSAARLATARRSLLVSVAVVLLLLGLEAWLVFEPLRRRMQAQMTDLVAAKEQAEAGMRARGEFLARMSHEIRTPLHGVVGMIEALNRQPDHEVGPEARQLVRLLGSASGVLSDLLNDVLDLSRLRSGRVELAEEPLSIPDLLHDCADRVRSRAASEGLTVKCELAPEAPVWVQGDRTRLRQVVDNLTSNAVKCTPSGSVTLRSTVGPLGVRLEVVDTGIGIPADQLRRIFDAFIQSDQPTSAPIQGTGLGLSIVSALVEDMSGKVDVESVLGEGSRFVVDLPLPAVAPPVAREVAAEATDASTLLTGRRVLLVDDNPLNRVVGRLQLESLGASVEEADSGEAALACVDQGDSFDLVLMDLHMPRMSGVQAAEELMASLGSGAPPIWGLTASALPEDQAACRQAGMGEVLVKPLRRETLVAHIYDHPHICARGVAGLAGSQGASR